jgi:hypothetical protein
MAVVLVSLIGNISEFRSLLALWNNQSATENVVLRTIYDVRDAPDLNKNAVFTAAQDAPTVKVGSLLHLETTKHGLPVPPESLASIATTHSRSVRQIVDEVLRIAVASGLQLSRARDLTTCANTGMTHFAVPSGDDQMLSVSGNGDLFVALGWASTPSTAGVFTVQSGAWTLDVPDVGTPSFVWNVVVSSPSASVSGCIAARSMQWESVGWPSKGQRGPV